MSGVCNTNRAFFRLITILSVGWPDLSSAPLPPSQDSGGSGILKLQQHKLYGAIQMYSCHWNKRNRWDGLSNKVLQKEERFCFSNPNKCSKAKLSGLRPMKLSWHAVLLNKMCLVFRKCLKCRKMILCVSCKHWKDKTFNLYILTSALTKRIRLTATSTSTYSTVLCSSTTFSQKIWHCSLKIHSLPQAEKNSVNV